MKGDTTGNMQSDALEIAAVLLLLQAGIGLVSALGLFVFAALSFSPNLAGRAGPLALLVPLLALALAAGLLTCHRWAWIGGLGFETLLVLGAIVRLLLSRGTTAAVVPLLTTVALPLSVLVLLCSRSARRATFDRTKHARMLQRPAPLEGGQTDTGGD